MSDGTKIEWAANADGSPGASWNPIRARTPAGKVGWFCVHASDGCKHCYAEAINRRLGTGVDYKAQNAGQVEIFLDERALTQPLRWRRPRTIFVCSMTDLFGEFVRSATVARVLAVSAMTPQHTYIVLTKRAARMRELLNDDGFAADIGAAISELKRKTGRVAARLRWPLDNVWAGVSVEDQANADKRIPDLLATPAAVRFLSAEPLLGPIDLTRIGGAALDTDARGITLNALIGGRSSKTPWHLNWVIVGGESGGNARPMHPDWARTLRDQCADAGVAFFMKQMTKKGPIPPDLFIRERPPLTTGSA